MPDIFVRARQVKNLAGKRFNRLVVFCFSHTHYEPAGGCSGSYWDCECDCGNSVIVRGRSLVAGKTKSCGCLQKEAVAKTGYANRIHGAKAKDATNTGKLWMGMFQRCYNNTPKNPRYRDYGGRGIVVCERWSGPDGYRNFLADMGEWPGPGYSLDRYPNNDGDYEPGNCRWATDAEQRRNARNIHNITFNGRTMCLKDWADDVGLPRCCVRARLKRGWSIEKTLTTPKL